MYLLFMKHQDVHNDWFMWTKVSYVWINLGFCRKICLRISRAVAVTRIWTRLWNARILAQLQPVQNLRIFSNNLMMFKIDLRNYRVRELSDIPSQLSIDHEFKHDMCISQPLSSKLNHLYPMICFSNVICRHNANRYRVYTGMRSIHEVIMN